MKQSFQAAGYIVISSFVMFTARCMTPCEKSQIILEHYEFSDERYTLPQDKLVNQGFREKKSWDRHAAHTATSLASDLLENSFWDTLDHKSQQEKDSHFARYALNDTHWTHRYHEQRFHIAAAIQKGANPNVRLRAHQDNALNAAVAHNDLELVELLLSHNADPNACSGEHKIQPLFLAKTINMARLLMMNGALITIRDPLNPGITIAEYHRQIGNRTLANYLQRALRYLKTL